MTFLAILVYLVIGAVLTLRYMDHVVKTTQAWTRTNRIAAALMFVSWPLVLAFEVAVLALALVLIVPAILCLGTPGPKSRKRRDS